MKNMNEKKQSKPAEFEKKLQVSDICCGCTACSMTCPKKAITMEEDRWGYKFAQIDVDKCVHCHLCEKVCPNNHLHDFNQLDECDFFASISHDMDTWEKSSSGGLFTEICKAFCLGEYIIVGAYWDEFDVKFGVVDSIDDISKFRKSKYVAADVGNVFEIVRDALRIGKKVVFSGTPCQVNGIHTFLQNESKDNLLTLDFICHGVGSPFVFKKWINCLNDKYKVGIKSYSFRKKVMIIDRVKSTCVEYTLMNDSKIINKQDGYFRSFIRGLHRRDACVKCRYMSSRMSDITLGDYKNPIKLLTDYAGANNMSLVVPNTEKGKQVISGIKNADFYKVDPKLAARFNPKIFMNQPENIHRKEFMESVLDDSNIEKLIFSYAPIYPSERIKDIMSERFCLKHTALLNNFDRLFRIILSVRRRVIKHRGRSNRRDGK